MTPTQQIARARRYMRTAWSLRFDNRATGERSLPCDVQMHIAKAHDALVLAADALVRDANIVLTTRGERAHIVAGTARVVIGDAEYRVDFK